MWAPWLLKNERGCRKCLFGGEVEWVRQKVTSKNSEISSDQKGERAAKQLSWSLVLAKVVPRKIIPPPPPASFSWEVGNQAKG